MNRLLEYTPEMEFLNTTLSPGGLHQQNLHAVMAFGAGLLEVGNDAELDHFLANLVSFVGATAHHRVAAPLRTALLRVLGRAVRHVLPVAHADAALATYTHDAQADSKIKAARIFGLELEGLSPEDKEFEIAQQFIRLASDTIRNAIDQSGPARQAGSVQARAEAALQQAARHYAPGLLTVDAAAPASGGRWQRQGGRITVFNC